MLVHEGIQSRQVVLVVDHLCLGVLVRCEFHEVLGLFLSELDTGSFKMTLHLFDFDVALAFGV